MKSKEELIQDFIDGTLAEEDKLLFNHCWENDSDFREQLAVQQDIHQILKSRLSEESDALRKNLVIAAKEVRQGTRHIRSWKTNVITFVAAACVLILASLFLFPRENSLYELPQMRSEIVRGSTDMEDNSASQRYEEAVEAFNKGLYNKSTKLLSDLQVENPEVSQYQYYHGLSLLGEMKYSNASSLLAELAQGESVFKNEALYYVAIAYYKEGRMDDAILSLEMVPENAAVYDKAQLLLKTIQKEKK